MKIGDLVVRLTPRQTGDIVGRTDHASRLPVLGVVIACAKIGGFLDDDDGMGGGGAFLVAWTSGSRSRVAASWVKPYCCL